MLLLKNETLSLNIHCLKAFYFQDSACSKGYARKYKWFIWVCWSRKWVVHVQYYQRSTVCALLYTCLYVCVCVSTTPVLACSLTRTFYVAPPFVQCASHSSSQQIYQSSLPNPLLHSIWYRAHQFPPSVLLHPYSSPPLVVHMDTGTEWVPVVCWPNLLRIYVYIFEFIRVNCPSS